MKTAEITLDSSCWISWLDQGDPRAELVDDVVDTYDGRIAVPTIVTFEIDRWLRRNERVDDAARFDILERLLRERQIPINHAVAVAAGRLGAAHGLATADALVAGAAYVAGTRLATFDSDFAGVEHADVLRLT